MALGARVELGVPLARHQFAISGVGVVHTIGPVFARVLAAVELRLPAPPRRAPRAR
ncbi:MAG: hypothetical protein H6713_16545 [Myxococcales bacterium]|nr:hypothetical protein [Myxococcales bacterium]